MSFVVGFMGAGSVAIELLAVGASSHETVQRIVAVSGLGIALGIFALLISVVAIASRAEQS